MARNSTSIDSYFIWLSVGGSCLGHFGLHTKAFTNLQIYKSNKPNGNGVSSLFGLGTEHQGKDVTETGIIWWLWLSVFLAPLFHQLTNFRLNWEACVTLYQVLSKRYSQFPQNNFGAVWTVIFLRFIISAIANFCFFLQKTEILLLFFLLVSP